MFVQSLYSAETKLDESLRLITDGKCFVTIVNVGSPGPVEKHAAELLQEAFSKACGVKPGINSSEKVSGFVEIRLGLSGNFKTPVGESSEQAYAIRREGNAIELVGNSPSAVLWAVSDFCERILNVSRPTLGDLRHRGPIQSTLEVNDLNIVELPDFDVRGWIIASCEDGPMYNQHIVDFMGSNRQNMIKSILFHYPVVRDRLQQFGIAGDTNTHSFYLEIPDTYYAAHPEYFPLLGGKRTKIYDGNNGGNGPNMCVSNDEVAQIIIGMARDAFRKYPELRIFPVASNDSGIWCQCEKCRAWDGPQAGKECYSNRLIRLVNKVANAIAKEFPDRKIGTLAYSNWIEPPTIEVAPNVIVSFCPGMRNYARKLTDPNDATNRKVLANLKGWLDKACYVYFYEYYETESLQYCPSPIAKVLVEEYADLKKLGLKGIESEIIYGKWNLTGRLAYIASRSMWDTNLTYDQILEDYCNKMYGPAAQAMTSYHSLYDQTILEKVDLLTTNMEFIQDLSLIFSPKQMAELEGYLKKAEQAVNERGTTEDKQSVTAEWASFKTIRRLAIDPRAISGIGPNLLCNSGAEENLNAAGWFTNIQNGDYELAVDDHIAHSGKRSFRINCKGKPGWARWGLPSIPVEKGQRYALSVWARGPGGKVLIWQNNLMDKTHIGWSGTGDQWKRIVIPEFVAKTDNILLCLETYGTGTVYYDDVFMAKLPDSDNK
jgi:hypothetical protein